MNEEDRNDGDVCEGGARHLWGQQDGGEQTGSKYSWDYVRIDSEPPQVGVFMEYDVHTVYWE